MIARFGSLLRELAAGRVLDAGRPTVRKRLSADRVGARGLRWRISGRWLASVQGPVLVATLASAAITALAVLWPQPDVAVREPRLHVVIETIAAIVPLIAAFLIAGYFAHRRRLDDLILAYALSLFAMTNFAFGVVPMIEGHGAPSDFATWTAFNGRLVSAIAFATAAFAPARYIHERRKGWTIAVVPAGVLALTAAATAFLAGNLQSDAEARLAQAAREEGLTSHPIVLVALVGVVALFMAAGFGFARRAQREHNRLIGWLAIGSVFAAFARINGIFAPSNEGDAVAVEEGFRLLFYMTILAAAAHEVRSQASAAAEVAVLEERRRIARDLHDGLTQELAFIGRNLWRLDRHSPVVDRLEAATARALEESRRAIAALTDPLSRPLDVVLAEVAQEVTTREGGRVALSLARGLGVTPAEREVLVRITSEAITNAVRHGGANAVHVELKAHADGLRLRVVDHGRGFDPSSVPPGHFGLVSMRERAEAVGGQLYVRSLPNVGTEVEAIL